MNREQRRAQDRALPAAANLVAQVRRDPVKAAAEIESLRNLRTGAYALMQVLVSRAGGGPIDIPRGEWKALPPGETLKVQVDPSSDDVKLWIEKA